MKIHRLKRTRASRPRLRLLAAGLATGPFASPLRAALAQAWGYNQYGQLGNGTTIDSNAPAVWVSPALSHFVA